MELVENLLCMYLPTISLNVFRMWGMAFIPDKLEPDIDRESDAKAYTRVNCLDVIFKHGIH
jgi:hypothetical protein